MSKYISDIDKVYAGLKQMHRFAVPYAMATKPFRYKRWIDLPCHICISFENIGDSLAGHFLMPVVEEERCTEHITIAEMILFHIQPEMFNLFLHHRDDARFTALAEQPYGIWLAVNADAIYCKICHFLHSCTSIVHKREHGDMPATLPCTGIRLLKKQLDTLGGDVCVREAGEREGD